MEGGVAAAGLQPVAHAVYIYTCIKVPASNFGQVTSVQNYSRRLQFTFKFVF